MSHSYIESHEYLTWLKGKYPDEFKGVSKELVRTAILNSNPENQEKLWEMQSRIQKVRDEAKNPIEACHMLYYMMSASVTEMQLQMLGAADKLRELIVSQQKIGRQIFIFKRILINIQRLEERHEIIEIAMQDDLHNSIRSTDRVLYLCGSQGSSKS